VTSAQAVETSGTNNSSFQKYPHLDDHPIQTTDTPGFKPFTMLLLLSLKDGEKLLSKREKEILQDLILQAVVGIEDPVREQVRLYLPFQCQLMAN